MNDGSYLITVDHNLIIEGINCFISSTLLHEMGHVLHAEYYGWKETEHVQHGRRFKEMVKKFSKFPEDKVTRIAAEEVARKHECFGNNHYHCWLCELVKGCEVFIELIKYLK